MQNHTLTQSNSANMENEDQSSDSSEQAYQYTRAIRFKLEPCDNALSENIPNLQDQSDAIDRIGKFFDTSKKLIEHLEKYIYEPKDETERETKDQTKERKSFKNSLEVKTQFLKQHGPNYYEWCQQNQEFARTYKLFQFGYSHELFNNFLSRWKALNLKTNELIKRFQNINEPEKRPRRSEFALLISQFKKRENLAFLRDFIDLSQDKETDKIKDKLQDTFEEFSENLKICEKHYLPSQTSGIEIARASLNYHTINKKPIDYPEEIQKKKDELKDIINNDPNTIFSKVGARETHKNIIREFVVQRIFRGVNEFTRDDLYKKLKEYKAKEKSKFKEAIDQGLKFDDISKNHPLFVCNENEFEDFIQRTEKIKKLSDQITRLDQQSQNYRKEKKQINEKINKIRNERGAKFFRDRSGNNQYKKFCNLYKDIAMKRGKVLARIKCLEKEKIESQLLNYWALILEKQNHHYLIFISKANRQKALNKIKKERNTDNGQQIFKIHYFKSLTLRALKKLCFGTDGNTFTPEIRQELKTQYQNKYSNIKGAFSLEIFENEKEKEKIKFYQNVLNTDHVRRVLDIQDFNGLKNLIQNTSIETFNEFQIELEKICYIKHILADADLEKYLLDECQAQLLKITSYDLHKSKDCKGKDKSHTQIWKQFWDDENKNQHYPVRLNPELKVYWRDAKESRVKKYGKDSELYNPNKNNRFLHPQFTLVTTFNKNAISQRHDLAFLDQDKLAEKIKQFNQRFNKDKNLHQTYFYGIDRGDSELATLMICKFEQKNNNSLKLALDDPKFKIYRLKKEYLDDERDYKNHKKKVIKNLSYFINDKNFEDLFEERETSSIDLTTAKLIDGKIIENGDVLSYLKLKELNAKRRLYENQQHIDKNNKEQSLIYFDEKEKVFCIHTKTDHNPKIYFYHPDLEKIQSKDQIEEKLKNYLKDLQKFNRERDILTIEKINHLRDALASNIIGIISHLYQQFPGIIALENLSENDVNKHFMKSNENISRRLEWRLYNKFQTQCLVPPHIKETILLRETKSVNQFGLIQFVPEEYTSQTCPQCGKIATCTYKDNKVLDKTYLNRYKNRLSAQEKEDIKKKNKELKEIYKRYKVQEGRFKCPYCNFDTIKHPIINTSDAVASYNIARKAYEHILNPESEKKTQNDQIQKNKRKKQHNGNKSHSRSKEHSNHQVKTQYKRNPSKGLNQPFKEGLKDLVINQKQNKKS